MATVVTYNGYTLPNVFGVFGFQHDYNSAKFSCNFRIEESSSSSLVSECKDAEAALRQPYQDLVVQFDGSSELSFSHDDNTGLNISPSLVKLEDALATETSRAYRFECSLQLPADLEDFDFRQSATFKISENESGIQIVTFNLTYTASPSPNEATALANFNTFAEAYCESVLDTLTGTFELLQKEVTQGDQIKFSSGTLVYKELVDKQVEASLDDSDIISVRASYAVDTTQERGLTQIAPIDAPTQVRVYVDYEAKIKKAVSVELNGAAEAGRQSIAQKYRDKIRPWLIEHSFDVLGLSDFQNAGGSYIIERDRRRIDPVNYTISGSLQLFTPRTLTEVLDVDETITTKTDQGKIFKKLWNRRPDSYYRFNIGSTTYVSRSIRVRSLGGEVAVSVLGGNLELLDDSKTVSKRQVGDGIEDESDLTTASTVTETIIQESYIKVDRSAIEDI